MGDSISTERLSHCTEYLSIGVYNDPNDHTQYELMPDILRLSDKQKSDITTIMIAKKNQRGACGKIMSWKYDTDNIRILMVEWDKELNAYRSKTSVFNSRYRRIITKKYIGEIHRLAIHCAALRDYIENGPEGEIYKKISDELAAFRTPITVFPTNLV